MKTSLKVQEHVSRSASGCRAVGAFRVEVWVDLS